MALNNNLRLLAIAFYLVATFHVAISIRAPGLSPAPQPESSAPKKVKHHAQVPSPAPLNQISFPPSSSISKPPTQSASPPTQSIKLDISSKITTSNLDPQVVSICKSTDHPQLCEATVIPLLKGKNDPQSILEISIAASDHFAKNALELVEKIVAEPDVSAELLPALKDCKGSYKDALDNFDKALSAFPEHDIGTMQSMLSAVITDVGDCQEGFKGSAKEAPIATYAEMLTNMTSNCLAIIEHIG